MEEGKIRKLEMKDISIEFPGVKALSNVDFILDTGSVHALIGANGAGKSTLMKILAGAYDHYTGDILIDNNMKEIRTPKDAKELGIGIVYQEVDTALIPYLSVAENIMLDVIVNEMKGEHFINWTSIHAEARKVLERLSIKIDTRKLVQDLTLAHKQMVLIARAIAEESKYLILDEPTAPLSNTETQDLFNVVKDLAYNHNVGVVFISHRLPEIFEICQEITILKDGQLVTRRGLEGLTPNQVVELMLGRKFEESYKKNDAPIGEKIFEVKDLSEKEGAVKKINLYVRAGETIGIAGLVGAGKTELCKTIFGGMPIEGGEILLNGKPLNIKTPYHAVKQGIALVPEERRKEGVLVEEPVYSNLTAACLSSFCGLLDFLKPHDEYKASRKMIDELGIKTPSEKQKVAYLSGGNQQKVAVGKWLMADADIYIFDEPTKGVDVGAKRDIFELIGRLAHMGKGIIYASCEFSEILGISDRTYVMYDGEIAKELVTAETNEEELLYFSTGGK
ncbi:monosaccharide ABC transporter ATP-binding protein, CUT2 family (TC 3.A.1.2.-) [Natronincola peptidivorans]|uniref:Ribose/galactose/methyl galactoside import ATP-binding protein n=1 Tax=Natronincola peptidivorans TaxID=426128 RepID=A0A1I0D151_9FIRM|nr:sugar ABC transporter ATP-binding protein [Natronincola peptidivorans]SET25316.1 monosaccharide ABC transporter ATP-binding protein, CUT2 family (TC 3.A.1.2.-) [Natronincola peptidivorans]